MNGTAPGTQVNGFTLQKQVYFYNKRPCRLFEPKVDLEGKTYYWVKYLNDDYDVTVVPEEDLEILNKAGKVLFGNNIAELLLILVLTLLVVIVI